MIDRRDPQAEISTHAAARVLGNHSIRSRTMAGAHIPDLKWNHVVLDYVAERQRAKTVRFHINRRLVGARMLWLGLTRANIVVYLGLVHLDSGG